MDVYITPDEQRLLDYAQQSVSSHNQMRHSHGGVDTLYPFLLSESGEIYDGASFEPDIAHSTFCAERCALANMVLQESYSAKIKTIVIADPVPEVQEHGTPPCGTCRQVIHQFATPKTSVLSIQYIQRKDDWIFPKTEKWMMSELYPYPYQPVKDLWDNYVNPQA